MSSGKQKNGHAAGEDLPDVDLDDEDSGELEVTPSGPELAFTTVDWTQHGR